MNEPSKPIALFDMDGTIADYVSAMKRDMESLRSPDEPETAEVNLWDVNVKHIKARKETIEKTHGWWRNLEPIPVGIEVMKIAQELGFEIRILTKGPKAVPQAWAEKLEWCQHHLGKKIQVTITRDKGTVYGRVLVDDYWPFMEGWLKHRPNGLGLMPGASKELMPADDRKKAVDHPRVAFFDSNILEQVEENLILARNRKEGEPLGELRE